jgi:hypothetical protein
MPPKAKLTKDKEAENESATDGVAEPGGISAILDLLRIIQKDMDELMIKEENRIIKSQLVSHQEPIKLTEQYSRHQLQLNLTGNTPPGYENFSLGWRRENLIKFWYPYPKFNH